MFENHIDSWTQALVPLRLKHPVDISIGDEIGLSQRVQSTLLVSLILASALYLQSFDNEKYKYIQIPELQNNNHPRNRSSNKTSLSLAGLRIDERGGIYLNPLLDSNSAYFKCYVAEDLNSADLIGYILFFNTLDESRSGSANVGGHDDPVAVIEDLFVKPKYRGRGIATQLWRKVLKVSCSICIWS